jgi:hypothetical protein
MCIGVTQGWYMQYMYVPGKAFFTDMGVLTLAEIQDLYVETPATGLSEPISW